MEHCALYRIHQERENPFYENQHYGIGSMEYLSKVMSMVLFLHRIVNNDRRIFRYHWVKSRTWWMNRIEFRRATMDAKWLQVTLIFQASIAAACTNKTLISIRSVRAAQAEFQHEIYTGFLSNSLSDYFQWVGPSVDWK